MLIYGAGEAGLQTARALIRDPQSDALPVAFLDDDPSKAGLRTQGLRVVGSREHIEAAATAFQADSILIAMPSAPHEALVDVADRAQRAGLKVQVLPRLSQIVEDGIRVRDIREMTLADFLERDEVHLDLDQITGYLQGKRVLVTGAGGSIGSELCETIRGFQPDRLLMLDHSENNLHRLFLRMHGSGSLDSPDLILADIRDPEALREIFERERPQVVFHAAAHKHVPFLEAFPGEAIKTNVYGTLNVLVAASEVGVERFVNISTDKAADPINMLGITKRIGERFTAHFAPLTSGVFMSVRFGNVLGSDGSVIPTFREQILQGRPLTVTHAEATRYFMTIPEAVQLVVQAGAIGGDGTVLVLEMGEPVKILDLAHRLSAQLRPGLPVNIEMIGLRPGEKLHESLFSASDKTIDKPHEQLWRCEVPPLNPSALGSPSAVRDLDFVLALSADEEVSITGPGS
jgi:FlaA1/EpsC-like NDP-sugar epimerase